MRHGFLRRHAFKIGASLLLGAGLAWLLERGGLPLVPQGEAFARPEAEGLAAAMSEASARGGGDPARGLAFGGPEA